jgi:D-arabinonate dehydratase
MSAPATTSADVRAKIDLDLEDTIVDVESIHIRIPLSRPVGIALGSIAHRDYNLCRARTASGIVGVGYARGGDLVHVALDGQLAPLLRGRPADLIEETWDDLYRSTLQLGRRGAVLRAISAVDIALWDIRCRRHGTPLWRLLGGGRDRVPCYASGGYYSDGNTIDALRTEAKRYESLGFTAMKIKIGALSVDEDLARVDAVLDAVGGSLTLMVDANTGYEGSFATAARAALELSRRNVDWLEEPFGPDNLEDSARLAKTKVIAIAAGEQESTRWGFRGLLRERAVDVAQPDVTVVGGISEWLRVAELAATADLPLAPHYFPEVHAQLASAVPETRWVEYFLRETDIVNFDDVLAEPLSVMDGHIVLGDEPGVGLRLDERAVARYRVR